ncbi:hypothetical protein A5658_02625 [Mycobacterium sp. 1245111.1]|uniref:hypothetical protein n=1 Tax=Mycobacterium sp. 1245111.1 TaxID=1834073 RepID=UPI0007FFA5C0|nr:hypothetical protein [Mycobacterium sp. 1245111.1]OBK41158.1 hypothetical protein A5658_02625 [Mycobacterium sp. 1245111.1]
MPDRIMADIAQVLGQFLIQGGFDCDSPQIPTDTFGRLNTCRTSAAIWSDAVIGRDQMVTRGRRQALLAVGGWVVRCC